MITVRNEDATTTGEIWRKCLQVMCEKHALIKFVNKLYYLFQFLICINNTKVDKQGQSKP